MTPEKVTIVRASTNDRHGMTISELSKYITTAHDNGVDANAQLRVNITRSGGIKTIENRP